MRVRRTSVVAVSSVIAVCSVLVGVSSPGAHADAQQDIVLPAGPDGMKAYSVSFGDGVVYATWGDKGFGRSTAYVAPDDGTGTWQQLHVPSSGDPISDVQSVDDGVFVQYAASATCTRVVTGTTDWLVPGCTFGVNVGHGGELVAVQRYDPAAGHYWYDVYDADAGPGGGVLDTTSLPPALADTWVWTGSRGLLSGVDTATDDHRSIPLGDSCGQTTVLEVVGDEATVHCVESGTTRTLLVDLTGTTRPVDVSGHLRMLGNGYMYAGANGVVHTTDLSSALTDLDVTPYFPRGSGWYPGAGWVGTGPADYSGSTSGSPRIAYLADAQDVHVAVLAPVGSPPTDETDTTPPSITSTGGSPAAVRQTPGDTQMSFTWAGDDDETAAPSYDVQVKDSVSTEDAPGWQPLSGSQDTFDTSVEYGEPNDARVCFRVQAIDRVGNRSPWSSPRCTSVDDARPRMADGRADHPLWWRGVLDSLGRQKVTYHFHGDDDIGIASYDVQQRHAAVGRELGAWHGVADGLTVRRLGSTVGAGQETCFRARAHDLVGRVSGWGDRWCAISPLDDRTFAVHGGRRVDVRGALGGSVTKVPWHGPSVTHANLRGRSLAVLARSDLGGCPRVWWGGRVVMSRSCSGGRERRNGFTWYLVQLRKVHHGTVRVAASVASNWTEVDAVAVGR